jgi:hypothetical protein
LTSLSNALKAGFLSPEDENILAIFKEEEE